MPTNQGRTYGRDSEKKESGSRNKREREREAGREEEEREKKVEGSGEKKKITLLLYVDQSVSQLSSPPPRIGHGCPFLSD